MSNIVTLPTPTRKEEHAEEHKRKREPRYNVVLLNDDDHSYEYVILMLEKIFGHPKPVGFLMAWAVDKQGRAVVYTCEKEHAEFYKERIESHGPDRLIKRCKGSMSAIIEPIE
ncbi:MAG TPA: ATP-dependent Clp protease adaptor ClpS [Candidatus Obscuribacterales bacterium]